jgi:hypothetical protein
VETDAFSYLIQQILLTPIKNRPYSYFHAEQIFPEQFYLELISNIPDSSYFSQLGAYNQRAAISLVREELQLLPFSHFLFWHKFATSIGTLNFAKALFKKFQRPLKKRFGEKLPIEKIGVDLSLVRDQPGYSIGPHTDHPNKIITLLFYLPTSHDQKHLGTSIYTPKDRSIQYSGHEHHSFDDFDKLSTMPFVPNSVFGFLRSDCSFHGVEPLGSQEKERTSLCYTLWEKP